MSPRSQGSRASGTLSGFDSRGGDENTKRRKLSSAKMGPESSSSGEEALSAPPCLVTLNVGIHITGVAAGGRHTLALSGKSIFLSRSFIQLSTFLCISVVCLFFHFFLYCSD